MTPLVRLLGSLRIAVPLLIAIALVLSWATIYEVRFGTAAVHRFVYQSWWFQGLLAFLAVNLALAAIERYPWKRRHVPFLLAHLGIILILLGGIIGGRFGIDGQLMIPEGQAEGVLQLPQKILVVQQPNPGATRAFPTSFEATAWRHQPHTLFRIPHHEGWITLVVDRYYPDAVDEEQVTGQGVTENPAIQLVLRHETQEEQIWLLARDPERFGVRWGQAHVLFVEPTSPQQLADLLGIAPTPKTPRGVVSIELPDLRVRQDIPVPDQFDHPVPIEGTAYLVTFKDYFTDFAIDERGVVNRSEEPNNPAVALTLSGPEGTEAFLVFALHPDFPAIHGQQPRIHARVRYAHATPSTLPANSVCLIRHPTGALSCVLTGAAGQRHVAACEIGRRYVHPWLGYQFEVLASYPRAALTTQFYNRSDEVRAEALHISAQHGPATATGWVTLRGALELPVGDKAPLRIEYRPAERELPFTITLLDFRKIDYPGTQMAAGFESDVELTDPKAGIVLIRTISMNNPLRYRGFSFYQSSYVPGPPETTILSVRNDPGTPLVYAGFLIVILGVVSMFVLRAQTAPHTPEGVA